MILTGLSAEWVSAIGTWVAAIGTVGAVLVVLFGPLVKRPKLSIQLQQEQGLSNAYWHGSRFTPQSRGAVPASVLIKQLRIWVMNDGRKEAKNCRVKLTVVDPEAEGRLNATTPIEFTLPAFLYYKTRLDETTGLLPPPEPGEVSVDVSARSKEAFELLYHREGLQQCFVYNRTAFPLQSQKRYLLKLRAYADDASPSKEVTYRFSWDGTEVSLSGAILPDWMPFPNRERSH